MSRLRAALTGAVRASTFIYDLSSATATAVWSLKEDVWREHRPTLARRLGQDDWFWLDDFYAQAESLEAYQPIPVGPGGAHRRACGTQHSTLLKRAPLYCRGSGVASGSQSRPVILVDPAPRHELCPKEPAFISEP